MHRSAGGVGNVHHLPGILGRHHPAAAAVVGVFQADQRSRRHVNVGTVPDGSGHVLRRYPTVDIVGHQPDLRSRQRGRTRRFIPEHVGFLPHDHLVATAAPGQRCDQIAHRPACRQQTRFLTHQVGGALLQGVDGRVFAKHIIANLGGGHCTAHLIGGVGNGITPQVNQCHSTSETVSAASPRHLPPF